MSPAWASRRPWLLEHPIGRVSPHLSRPAAESAQMFTPGVLNCADSAAVGDGS